MYWMEVYAGEKAFVLFNSWLPEESEQVLYPLKKHLESPLQFLVQLWCNHDRLYEQGGQYKQFLPPHLGITDII